MKTGLLHRLIRDFDRHDAFYQDVAPSGYTIAINIVNLTPELYHSTLPLEWVERYTSERYAMVDPVAQFALLGKGVKRWSELTSIKVPFRTKKFMLEASEQDLKYGLAIVRTGGLDGSAKHLLSIARGDRELSDNDVIQCARRFEQILAALNPGHYLTERQMNIMVHLANGHTRQSSASMLAISEETVKKEIAAIRSVLGAKNVTEAVGIAISSKIITPYNAVRW